MRRFLSLSGMKRYNKHFSILFSLIVVIIIMIVIPLHSTRAGLGFNSPFGGRVITKIPCTCSTGSQITLSPPSTGSYLYIEGGARLFRNYKVSIGNWVLGIHTSAGQCLVGAEPYCTTLPITKGTITVMIGTS